jgi:hypothetical protein
VVEDQGGQPVRRVDVAVAVVLGRAAHIEDAVRSTGRTIGKDEAERVKDALQAELDEAAAAKPSETAPAAIAS